MTASAAWIGSAKPGWTVEQGRRHFSTRKELNTRGADEQVLSLTLRGVVRNDPAAPEGLVPTDYNSYQVFGKDDLVFKLIDLENRRTSRVGLVPERGIMSPAYVRLIPKGTVVPRYAYWYYYSLWTRDVFNELGGGVRATLSSADLLAMPIALPPVDEQRRIAHFLDDQVARIDEVNRLRRGQIEALDQALDVSIESAVGGEAPGTNAEDYRYRYGQPSMSAGGFVNTCPKDWDRKRLKSVAHRSRTPRGSRDLPLLSLASAGYLRLRAEDQQPPSEESVPRYLEVRVGHLVVNPMWLAGNAVAVSGMDGAVSPDYRVFHLSPRVHPRFIHHVMRSRPYREQYRLYMRADTTFDRRVQQADLDNMPVALPPLEVQVRISEQLDRATEATSRAIGELSKSGEVLEERKRALITAAVTGELDVTTAKPIGMGKWVPNVRAGVEAPAAAQASSIGGIG